MKTEPYAAGRIVADRYRLVELVGEGGAGRVFRAEHIYIDKTFAVKLLHTDPGSDPSAVQRLRLEARATSRIGHRNIVRIEDFGHAEDGTPYLAMEWLHGETLDALLDRGPLDPAAALAIAAQICEGVGAAHASGVIHRDLKPANIFLTRDRRGSYAVKILDFGIAKLMSGDAGLTQTGMFLGTPHYIAPEQAMGHEVDHRADIYSLGVILYELFTDTVPFTADSFMGVLQQHTGRAPQPPSLRAPDRHIPTAVERVILRCLAKSRDDRYQSMAELCGALDLAGSLLANRRRSTARGVAVPVAKSDNVTVSPRIELVDGDTFSCAPRRRRSLAVIAPLALVAGAALAAYASLGNGVEPADAGEPPGAIPASTAAPTAAIRCDAGPQPLHCTNR